MFWDRNGVNWDSSQIKLLGEPSRFSGKHENSHLAKVNFADESGIYILYDHRTGECHFHDKRAQPQYRMRKRGIRG